MKKGFTLIELLVSIAILGVLIAITIGLYRSAQERSRDTRKKGDMTAIQHALEQYHADFGYYPTSISFGSALNNCTNISAGCTVNRIYLDIVPSNSSAYVYQALPNSYCLATNMEVAANISQDNQCSVTGKNFGVTAP